MELMDLIGKQVTVKGYENCGIGIVTDILNEEHYNVVVQFNPSMNIHESELVQYFNVGQLIVKN